MRWTPVWLIAAGLLAGLSIGCKEKDDVDAHAGHDHSAPGAAAHAAIGPESSAVAVDMTTGWCAEHGVPESVCTRCDESLVARFQEAGDWCTGHHLPESQCVRCNPEVEARWAALRPADAPAPATPAAATQPVATGGLRVLPGGNDPLCDVDKMQIRLADGTVVTKAGIEIQPAQHRRMASTVEVPAEVEYDARKTVRVTPRLKGILTRVEADLGDAVKAGDVLAVIESAELGEAKGRYLELRESLALAQADLERAAAIYQGTRQLLAESAASAPASEPSAQEPLAGEAKGRLLNARTSLDLAQMAFDRAAQLKKDGLTSQEAHDAARAALQKARTDYAIARDALAFESRRDRLAAEKSVRTARNALEVADRRLHLLGVSAAEIEALGTQPPETLSRYELRSPIDGQIIERRAAIGQAIDESDSLYTVTDLATLWLELDVPLREANLLAPGQQVLFTADGLPGQSFRARLDWISTEVDDRARTLKARAVMDNADRRGRAKMFGTARVAIHENDEVISVPRNAVQTDGCCQLVFVRKNDQVFEPRKVTLGTSANGYVEILNGLAAGEPVVTTGSFLMKTEILKSSIGAGCCEVEPGR